MTVKGLAHVDVEIKPIEAVKALLATIGIGNTDKGPNYRGTLLLAPDDHRNDVHKEAIYELYETCDGPSYVLLTTDADEIALFKTLQPLEKLLSLNAFDNKNNKAWLKHNGVL